MQLSEWQRAVVAMAAAVLTACVVAALYLGRSVLVPIALAVFFTFVLSPLVARLQRRGLGRVPSVLLVMVVVGLGAVGSGVLIAQQMARLSEDIAQEHQAERLKAKLVAWKQSLVGGDSKFGKLIDDVTGIVMPKPPPQETVVIQSAPSSMSAQLGKYMDPATEILGQAAFTCVLTLFMLLKREDLRNRIIRLIVGTRGRVTNTTKAVDDASRRISRYLLAQLLLNTAFGVVITIGLWLIGIEYAILWGFIATLMRYVPYIGTWVGLIPPTVFALAMYDQAWKPFAVIALFGTFELLCNNFFEPRLYGKSMGLSEVAQLVAAAFWAFLWGPIGLILSGPLTVCLLVLGKYVSKVQFLEVLLGDEPARAPNVAFYQRLAARDQDEASDIALEAAKDAKPEEVFDRLIIPALCAARRDSEEGTIDAGDVKFAVRAAREIGDEVAYTVPLPQAAPDEDRERVLLCPARDEIDHAAIDLLAHLIDRTKWEVEIAADETLASELLARVEKFRPAVVVLGATPPGGLSHCRYLAARLKKAHPEVKLVVGRWGRGDDFPEDVGKAGVPGADGIDATLGETRTRLGELRAIVQDAKKPAPRRPAEKLEPVGTAGASV